MLNDITKMNDTQKKQEYLARLETNLLFVMADVLECEFMECSRINRLCNYELRHEEKRHFNAALHHIKSFRGATRSLEVEHQESFGRDADLLLDVIYAVVTRTGTEESIMLRFLEYALSFPDRIGLDSVRQGSDAFEAIKKKLKIA